MKTMKTILMLATAAILMTTTGCVIREHHRGGAEFHERGEWRGHGDYRERSGYYHTAPEAGVNVRIHAD